MFPKAILKPIFVVANVTRTVDAQRFLDHYELGLRYLSQGKVERDSKVLGQLPIFPKKKTGLY